MAPRTGPGRKRPTTRRVEALEAQVARLAARLTKAERAAAKAERAAPKAKRAAAEATPRPIASRPGSAAGLRLRGSQATQRVSARQPARDGVRCPGCTLRVHEPRERCGYCGFLFSVLPPSRRPDRVLRQEATSKGSKGGKASLSLTRQRRDR